MSVTTRVFDIDNAPSAQDLRSLQAPASSRCAGGVVPETDLGPIYNEEVFHYLLAIEQKRSEHAPRNHYLLLLLDLSTRQGASPRIEPRIARRLFLGLQQCLRETDIIGWHRHDRVIGAILTEFQSGAPRDTSGRIRQRVYNELSSGLPSHVARGIQVRPYLAEHPHSGTSALLSPDKSLENNGC